MRKVLFIISGILFHLISFAQITNTGYTVPYNPMFSEGTTLDEIKQYLTSNINSLDPIEGLYDVFWESNILYEHVEPHESESSYIIAIIKNGNLFYFYAPYNQSYVPAHWLVIEPIGSTGIYNFMFTSKEDSFHIRIHSKQRVPLEKGILFDYTHKLSDEELRAQDSQKYGIIGEVRNINGIKIFPEVNSK